MENYNIYLINTETEGIIKEKGLIRPENENFILIDCCINAIEGLKNLEIIKNIKTYQSEMELNGTIRMLKKENVRIKIVKPEGKEIKINLEPSEFDYISEYDFITELETAQNLISRVKEVIGQMRDDIKKETGKGRVAISTCGSHDIYRILERSLITESILDELDQIIASDYQIINKISVSIIEFIINEIKKFKTKEEISQIFINGENFHFNSDTWQVIDKNIASIIRLKVR